MAVYMQAIPIINNATLLVLRGIERVSFQL